MRAKLFVLFHIPPQSMCTITVPYQDCIMLSSYSVAASRSERFTTAEEKEKTRNEKGIGKQKCGRQVMNDDNIRLETT